MQEVTLRHKSKKNKAMPAPGGSATRYAYNAPALRTSARGSKTVDGRDLDINFFQDKQRMMTDRAAYMSFLEVQLERVSASCLTVQAYSERIEAMQTQCNTMEEKILNCGRIIKMMQQYNEQVTAQSERTKQMVEDTTKSSMDRIAVLEDRFDGLENKLTHKIGEGLLHTATVSL